MISTECASEEVYNAVCLGGSKRKSQLSLNRPWPSILDRHFGKNMNRSHTAARLPADAAQARGKIVDKSKLLRVLGIGFGLSVTLGGTIGAGIMRTPGEIAARLPDAWLIVGSWLIGGAYSLIGSFAMSELGAMIPRAGGYYVFVKRAFGDYAGFVIGWADWLSLAASTAAVSMVISEYAADLFAPLRNHILLVGCAAATLLAVLQWRGIRWASWFQNATSAITALVFLGLIALAFVVPHAAVLQEPLRQQPASSLSFFVACVLVLQAVIYTYDGWYSIIYFGEEIHNPGRDVPRSMIGGVLLLTGIYVLINVALLYVLPVSSIAGQNLAVGALTRVLFGGYGDLLLRAVMIVSLASLVNVNLLCLPRVLFAMSRDGWSSASIGRVNKGGTPSVALFLSLGACLLLIVSGSFDRIIALAAFFNVAKYTMAYVAVFMLRRREPEAALPYRAWGHPWTTGAAVVGSLAFVAAAVTEDTRNSLYAVIVLLSTYPLYRWLGSLCDPAQA
jgi:APA family basic amino acid/polyamine antiporter